MSLVGLLLALGLGVTPVAVKAATAKQDRFDALAVQGQIQDNAPVKAASEITIHASPEKIWSLLANIDGWPKWQSNVTAAHLDGPLAPGTGFTWTSGGAKIKSRLALVKANQQIGWTGTAYKARAIHIWSLQALPDGSTVVKTIESMAGFLLTVFYSSKELAASHKVWLEALKRKAEEQNR